jgi:ATP-dependent Clp protease ATP-binding subunit ClpA
VVVGRTSVIKSGKTPMTGTSEDEPIDADAGPGGESATPSTEHFTDRARRVMLLAQEEARRLDHAVVEPEHLLLALIGEGQGTVAKLLVGAGVDLDEVRVAVERLAGRGAGPVRGDLSLSPRSERVIQLAREEAGRLNRDHVGTEHLLLALLRPGHGVATSVLTGLGLDRLRRDVVQTVRQQRRRRAGIDPQPAIVNLPGRGLVVRGEREAPGGTRDSVITIRVSDADLAAVDSLVEVGIMKTRSEAAAWLLHAGITANGALFEKAQGITAEIRRLREDAQRLVEEHAELAQRATPEADEGAAEPAPWRPVYRLSERARNVLGLAEIEARGLGHNYIGTEHVLLGLVREDGGVAARILADFGVRLDAVRAAIEKTVGRGKHRTDREIPRTPRAQQLLALAADEVRRSRSAYIGTEHLLLGLLLDNECLAAGVLRSLGVSPGDVRDRVTLVLNQGQDPSEGADEGTQP